MQKIKALTGKSSLLVAILTKTGEFCSLNSVWRKAFNWEKEELLGNAFTTHIHPKHQNNALSALRKVDKGQETLDLNCLYRCKNGEFVEVQWAMTPGTKNNETILTGRVMAEIYELEERIQDNAALFERATRLIRLGHWSIDLSSKALFWSNEIYNIHALTPKNYTPELDSAIEFYHPEDRAIVRELVDRAFTTPAPWDFKLRIIRSDGEIRTVHCIAEPHFNDNGEAIKLSGSFQDITDHEVLNEQVELLSKVAETTLAGVVICDANKNVIWVNNAFETITKYTAEEVYGKSLGQFLQGPDTDPETVQEIRTTLAAGQDVNVEILNYDKNGAPYWNQLLISPITKGGTIVNFIGIQHDITARKRESEISSRSQKMGAIGKLAGGICHDMNNIMAIISGNTQLLKLKNSNPDLEKCIANLERATERASGVTKRLLKTVRNEARKPDIINLDEELRHTIESVSPSFPEGIIVGADLGFHASLFCNKHTFLDAITNLLVNAKNAIEKEGRITLRSELSSFFQPTFGEVILHPRESEEYCLIQVEDTGKGINKSNLSKIFDPFFSTKAEKSSAGLGLSLLFQFALEEGYGIQVSSRENMGTTFSLWIPLNRTDNSELAI
ncbi:PAS domain-containing protein [Lacimicrobium sp. SS2-24]|uniref:PAS domain-containing protein n=1 Tax=Lacimicrobium sp. SS2-24 TaxID=2005569 RepID=UPI001439F258|nr:PAS domain-containing protein [Lacimicrobium sp. SS2-24]